MYIHLLILQALLAFSAADVEPPSFDFLAPLPQEIDRASIPITSEFGINPFASDAYKTTPPTVVITSKPPATASPTVATTPSLPKPSPVQVSPASFLGVKTPPKPQLPSLPVIRVNKAAPFVISTPSSLPPFEQTSLPPLRAFNPAPVTSYKPFVTPSYRPTSLPALKPFKPVELPKPYKQFLPSTSLPSLNPYQPYGPSFSSTPLPPLKTYKPVEFSAPKLSPSLTYKHTPLPPLKPFKSAEYFAPNRYVKTPSLPAFQPPAIKPSPLPIYKQITPSPPVLQSAPIKLAPFKEFTSYQPSPVIPSYDYSTIKQAPVRSIPIRAADSAQAYILNQDQEINPDGSYRYSYDTENGIVAQEKGISRYMESMSPPQEVEEVAGSFSYTSPDGTQIALNYIANEDGFQPQGNHLPTPPPIPDAILRSIQYNIDHPNDY